MAALAATLAVPALGRLGVGESFPTELKIRDSFPAFHGKVRSAAPPCEPDRRVKLFKERRNGGSKLLGRTDSNERGKWEILVDPLKSGAYYAKAKRHIVPADRRRAGTGGLIVCEPDFSRTLVVD